MHTPQIHTHTHTRCVCRLVVGKATKRDILVNVASSWIVEPLQKLIYQKDICMLDLYKEKAIPILVDEWIVKLPVRTPTIITLRQFFSLVFLVPSLLVIILSPVIKVQQSCCWHGTQTHLESFASLSPVLFLNNFLHMCSMLERIQLLAVLTRFTPELCKNANLLLRSLPYRNILFNNTLNFPFLRECL